MYGALQGKIGQHDDRVCLEVTSFLTATWRTSVACSRRVHRVSTSNKDLLMKNTGFCFWFSSSLNKAALTETSETSR